MNEHTRRSRFFSLTIIALTFGLALSFFVTQPAPVHAASLATPQTIAMTINGKTYFTAPGGVVQLPTTYADGSKGWIDFSAGVGGTGTAQSSQFTDVVPNTVNCRTASATQTFHNTLGAVLFSYTLSQYWCWDGTHITNAAAPGNSFQANLGWSLNREIHNINLDDGLATGQSNGVWRFNGPFGIGCKSGRNSIFFNSGGISTNSFDTNSYFGC